MYKIVMNYSSSEAVKPTTRKSVRCCDSV